MTKKQTGLQLAIAHAGGARIFSRLIDSTPAQVEKWLSVDKPIKHPDSAVLVAIEKAGGATELARALGVSPQSVWDWRVKGYVPPARAKEIEMQYGIPRNDLVSAKVRSNLGLGGEL